MKSILDFQIKKSQQQKISMITCYDYTSARIISNTSIDCVLVGDSGSMVLLGKENTVQTSMDDMAYMTQAVARGLSNKLLIADMPFLSYRSSLKSTMDNVQRLIQAGAHAVKLEAAAGNSETIKYIVESGIPVIGHLGLTPQFIHAFGGYRVQGKTHAAAKQLIDDAKALEAAGCCALVLECVPSTLATTVTEQLSIPTIGIGAGAGTNGQVLVFHDLLGLNTDFTPKFVKQYLQGATLITDAVNNFVTDINNVTFPSQEHTYTEQ